MLYEHLMKVIKEKNIYPDYDTPLQKHFGKKFNHIQICFLPFFRIPKKINKTNKGSVSISEKEAITELGSIKGLKEALKGKKFNIYTTNRDYPKQEVILKEGLRFNWKDILSNSNFKSYREINRALKISIGSYKRKLLRQDLQIELELFTKKENLWYPIEGRFDAISKSNIYDILEVLGITRIYTSDEFYENIIPLEITNLKRLDFISSINFDVKYIYSENQDLLFAIDWDSFFFLTVTNKEYHKKIKSLDILDGFLTDRNTTHNWDWETGEINRLLNY